MNPNRGHIYEHITSERIACLCIDTHERWPQLDATGCGECPCIIVTWEDGEIETINFDYPEDWIVFCASSMKHGFNIVLTNRKMEE